jgi:spermidine synthase
MKITSAKLKQRIFHKQSKFQKIEVYETENLGKSLFLDDIEQFSEGDEIEYHSTMTKVPFSINKKANKILIIGGGDGAIARECLKYDSVNSIDLCEIDEDVVSVCKEYFPQMASSFSHEKMNVIYEDAKNFVKKSKLKYDIILIDSTDPINQATPLFKKDFYEDVNKMLKPNGLLVCQMESAAFNTIISEEVFKSFYEIFNFINFFFCKYERSAKIDPTLFSICSQKNATIPKKISSFFVLDQKQYKTINNFKLKLKFLGKTLDNSKKRK